MNLKFSRNDIGCLHRSGGWQGFRARVSSAYVLPGICLFFLSCLSATAAVVSYEADAAATAPDPKAPEGGSWFVYSAPDPNPDSTPNPSFGVDKVGGKSWNYMTPVSQPTEYGNYQKALPDLNFTDPLGWTATARIKADRIQASGNNLLVSYLRIFDGTNQFMVSFINNGQLDTEGVVFLKEGMEFNNQDDIAANLKPLHLSDDYVTVQIHFQPATSDQPAKASLYANGVLIDEVSADKFSADHSKAAIRWGKATKWHSDVRWNEVKFETGNTVVPEP